MMGSQREQLYNTSKAFSRDSHGTHTSTTRSAISKHLDVEELEMLLEAYFVQIDGTLNKLSTVSNSKVINIPLINFAFFTYLKKKKKRV